MRIAYAAVAALLLLPQVPLAAAERDPTYSGQFIIRVTEGFAFRLIDEETREYQDIDLTGQEGRLSWSVDYLYNYLSGPNTPDGAGPIILPRVTVTRASTSGLSFNFGSSGISDPYQDGEFSSSFGGFTGDLDEGSFGAGTNCNSCPDNGLNFTFQRVNGRFVGQGDAFSSDDPDFRFGGQIRFDIIGGSAIAEVPEPATWAMMIAGFGAVGAAARRRRVTVRYA